MPFLEAVTALIAAPCREALRCERGQSLAEYGLILTLIAIGVVVPTAFLFQSQVASAFSAVTNCLMQGC